MQNINFTKVIELENKIQDLLLMTIDDKLETTDDRDGVRISGNISISGKAKTIDGEKSFSDLIDLEIFLAYEQIEERNSLNVTVKDFNYKLEENKLNLDITVTIEGLKEITTTFLAQENNESFLEEEINENDYLESKEIETTNCRECFEEQFVEEQNIKDDNIEVITELIAENSEKDQRIKQSLLKSVFSNKRVKEEVSWKLHCVKKESTYEEIAQLYDVNVVELQKINKDEKLIEGKLIFIPLE